MQPRVEDSTQRTRVAIYARFSSEMQSPRSVDDQVRECRDFAIHKGWEIVAVEEDRAVRASAMAGRVGWSAILQRARGRTIDVVLFEELSRFSRDFFHGIREVGELGDLGVRIADTRNGVHNPRDQLDQLRLAIGLSSSQQETRRLGERTKRGLRGRVESRYSTGGRAPFGYRRQPEFSSTEVDLDGNPKRIGVRFVVEPTEAEAVRTIFERYNGGTSKARIARELNSAGILTPAAGRERRGLAFSGKWSASSVAGVLGNSIYVGERIWNRTSRVGQKSPVTGKGAQVANRREHWVHVEGFAPSIIDNATWERARLRLAKDDATYRRDHVANAGRGYLLSGLVRCTSCGRALTLGLKIGAVAHYRCPGVRTTACDNRTLVSQPGLEDAVRRVLDALVKDPEQLRALVAEHNERVSRGNEAQQAALFALHERRRELSTECGRLRDAIAEGRSGTVSQLLEGIETRTAEIARLDEQIPNIEAALQPLLLPDPPTVRAYVSGETSLFQDAPLADRAFLESVLRGIAVSPDGSIELRFQDASLFRPVAAYRMEGTPAWEPPLATARALHKALRRGAEKLFGGQPAGALVAVERRGLPRYEAAPGRGSLDSVGVPNGIRRRRRRAA